MKRILLFSLLILCSTTQPSASPEQLAAVCLGILSKAEQASSQIGHNLNDFVLQPVQKKWCVPITAGGATGAASGMGISIYCPSMATPCCIAANVLAVFNVTGALYTLRNNKPAHKELLERPPSLAEKAAAAASGCALALEPQTCCIASAAECLPAVICSEYVRDRDGVMFGEY